MGKDLATGDFNGDGKQDLAVINGSKTYVYRGPFKRSGTTGTVTMLDKTSSFYSTALIAGKVNGDSKTDLAIIGDVATPEYIASDVWFIKGGASSHPRPSGSVTVSRGHVETLPDGTEVKLGVWIMNQKSRRTKLSTDKLATLAGLGLEWATA